MLRFQIQNQLYQTATDLQTQAASKIYYKLIRLLLFYIVYFKLNHFSSFFLNE